MLLPLQITIGERGVEIANNAMRNGFLEIEVGPRTVIILRERSICNALAREERERGVWR